MAPLLHVDAATDPEVYRLKSDVAELRNQVRNLEQQVRALESQMRQQRSQPMAPAPVLSTSRWDQLRIGLSKEQVTSLLGEPAERNAGGDVWYYVTRAHVEFDTAGRVSGWKAP